jgi:four helix bundle protein
MANHSILYKLGKNFGKRTIMLCQYLLDKYDNSRIVARLVDQLLRCGTSIGANISEGQDAVSNADFVNKHAIALKEARETLYWLELLHETNYLTDDEFNSIYNDCNQLTGALVNSIKANKDK